MTSGVRFVNLIPKADLVKGHYRLKRVVRQNRISIQEILNNIFKRFDPFQMIKPKVKVNAKSLICKGGFRNYNKELNVNNIVSNTTKAFILFTGTFTCSRSIIQFAFPYLSNYLKPSSLKIPFSYPGTTAHHYLVLYTAVKEMINTGITNLNLEILSVEKLTEAKIQKNVAAFFIYMSD